MSAPANPYAFPSPDDDRPSDGYGMTLRDWFAGQALANAVICNGSAAAWEIKAWFGEYASGITKAQIISKQAGEYADAMLAERTKAPEASTASVMQHVGYVDEGQFHWMSGIAPRSCELYAECAKGGL